MNPTLILHTRHEPLARQIMAILDQRGSILCTGNAEELQRAIQRHHTPVVLFDLCCEEARRDLGPWLNRLAQAVVIALGDPKSEPARFTEDAGVFAIVESTLPGLMTLPGLVTRACEHARLHEENRQLRAASLPTTTPAPTPATETHARGEAPLSLRHFARTFRRCDSAEAMLERSVEALSAATGVARVGIVARLNNAPHYRLVAGLHCLEEIRQSTYQPGHPFVSWLETHAYSVSRSALEQASDPEERPLLQRMLEESGAELLAPLLARGRVLGWLLLGRRSSGRPFSTEDIEEMAVAADHVAGALENALLYEEVARQKSLAETLLHALPTGVVASDENGVVRWFSVAAAQLLGLSEEQVVGRPVEVLGSRLADQLHRAAAGEQMGFPEAWRDPVTQRPLIVQTSRLGSGPRGLGAVAMIQDLSAQQAFQEKQDQLERTVFWTELAASMSHEIRNPLVAIKTFAQLLPERYQDPEFRTSFSLLVSAEVDRLNSIIDQINDFAHPPSLKFHQLDVREPLQRSIALALPQGVRDGLHVKTSLADGLPAVWGDDQALADCFARLLRNASEALAGRADGAIQMDASMSEAESSTIQVSIRDNGPGIPSTLRDKVFSPFCTTKPRGMGLGLPIVKRTVVDHNGRVEVQTSQQGTTVTILLPAVLSGEHT